MKKISYLFLLIILLIPVTILAEVDLNNRTFTREELQQIVLSTALQFYYKNAYSDYDSGSLNGIDFRWRDLKITPEDVSTANYYMTDCSAFAYILYNSSLGYTAALEPVTSDKLGYQIEKYSWNRKFYTNFTPQTSSESIDAFQKGADVFGIGWYTNYLEKMAKKYWNAQEGVTYYDSNNSSPFVYYYRYPESYITASEEDIVDIDADDLLAKLEPGDIVVASRINNETGEEIGGHVLIYTGEEFAHRVFGEETDVLAFHSSTSGSGNYNSETVPIDLGNDSVSIQTASAALLKKHFKYHNRAGQNTYAVAIIRPINSYCTDNNCVVSTMNQNAEARAGLMFLKNEQFIEEYFKYNDYVNNQNKTIDMFISKYNSLNNHDTIRYNLRLTNKDEVGNIIYNNLTITGIVPEGTKYISCSKNCYYNSGVVEWQINDFSYNETATTYYFEVEIDTNNDIITYDGYNINYNNEYNLKLSPLASRINPTMKAVDKSFFNSELNKFKAHVDNNRVVFTTGHNDNYTIDYDDNNYSVTLSTLGFIESLYYNTMGIDLGFLSDKTTFSQGYNCNSELGIDYLIKTALFKYDCNKQITSLANKGIRAYATRTNLSEIDGIYYRTISDDEAIIRAMLVPGMYGGRALIGDDAQDRTRYIKMPHDFEFGDIIITFNGVNSDEIRAYLYLGRVNGTAIVASYDKDYFTNQDGTITSSEDAMLKIYNGDAIYDRYWKSDGSNPGKTSTRILKEIYASNLFVVLRPTRVYGTTIKYELNNGSTQNNQYIAYDKYRNLMVPTREGYQFLGWYSDSEFNNRVTNDSNLVSTSSHTLYAKWSKEATITLADTTKALTYKTSGTNAYTYDGDGTVQCSSSDSTYVTCSVDTTNHVINVVPVKKTSSVITITVSASAGSNYSAPDNKTFTVTVAAFTPTVSLSAKTEAQRTFTGSAIATNIATVTLTNNETYTGTITYTYYTNSGCSTGATTTAPTYGNYWVKASIAASGNYTAASSSCVNHNIVAATPTVTLTEKTGMVYNGNPQAANTATVSPNGGGAITYTYYTNGGCTTGATTTAPTAAGNYWVKASVEAVTGKTNVASSSCVAHTISAKEITINYYQGNGTSTPGTTLLGTSTCIYGETCTLNTYESLNGTFPHTNYRWEFAGWSTNEIGTNRDYIDGQSFMVTSENDINLYAIGRKKYSFYSGEAPTSTTTSLYQYWNPYSTDTAYLSTITLPTPINITNWNFYGYLLGKDDVTGEITYDASYVGQNVKPALSEIYRTYRSVYAREVILSYDANGGSGNTASQRQTQYYNTGYASGGVNVYANESIVTFTLANNDFTRVGYTFVGWSEASNGTNPMNSGSQYEYTPKVNESNTKTLYAVWQEGNYHKGDMNKNGRIDLSDIIMLLKVYLNGDVTDEELQIGDMDNNTVIGLRDIILLLKEYLNG